MVVIASCVQQIHRHALALDFRSFNDAGLLFGMPIYFRKRTSMAVSNTVILAHPPNIFSLSTICTSIVIKNKVEMLLEASYIWPGYQWDQVPTLQL